MIPSTFTILRQLPLTENGKVDRHELLTIFPPERLRDPPKSPFEKMVARTWETVLGRSKIGRDVNFFQLGGDSLRMTRVAVALREKLGYEPPLELLFAKPTIAELAAALERYHELDNDEKEHSLPAASGTTSSTTTRRRTAYQRRLGPIQRGLNRARCPSGKSRCGSSNA